MGPRAKRILRVLIRLGEFAIGRWVKNPIRRVTADGVKEIVKAAVEEELR